jgi:hypothetical protein
VPTGHAVLRIRPSGLSTFGSPWGAGTEHGSGCVGGGRMGGAAVVVVTGTTTGTVVGVVGTGGGATVVVVGGSVVVGATAALLHPAITTARNRIPRRRFIAIVIDGAGLTLNP